MRWDEFSTAYGAKPPRNVRILDGDLDALRAEVAADASDELDAFVAAVDEGAAAEYGPVPLGVVLHALHRRGEESDVRTLLEHAVFAAHDAAEWGRLLHTALSSGRAPDDAGWTRWADVRYAPRVDALFDVVERWIAGHRSRLLTPDVYLAAENTRQRLALLGGSRERLAAEDDEILRLVAGVLSGVSFHALQRQLLAPWVVLRDRLRGHGPPPVGWVESRVARAQVLLARAALIGWQLRGAVQSGYAADSSLAADVRGLLNGVLAELDVAVALLPMMLRDTPGRYLPLAAPPQFEMLAGRANADLIVVDVETRRVRGIQVKASGRLAAANDYDESRIRVVHAAEELADVAPVDTTRPARVAPAPGLHSLRVLSSWRSPRGGVHGLSAETVRELVRTADQALPPPMSDAGRRLAVMASGGPVAPSASEYQRRAKARKQATRLRVERSAEALIDGVLDEL